ncbi:MAG: hypothetical protein OK454_00145 [Thaumarchaeota archaeon]|nr:hypothetical protein [Nitrososphaerota archaeon]
MIKWAGWTIKHVGRGFIVKRGVVASFPMVARWYWPLFVPYMVFKGIRAVRNYD